MRKFFMLLAVSASFGLGAPAAASEVILLRQRVQLLEQRMQEMRAYGPIREAQRLQPVEAEIRGLRSDLELLRAEMRELREKVDLLSAPQGAGGAAAGSRGMPR